MLATLALAYFGYQQMNETNRLKALESSANWGSLRNTMWEVMDRYPFDDLLLTNMTREEKITLMQDIRKLLDSEIKNPILLQDKESLGHWRNAISTTKISNDLLKLNALSNESFLTYSGTIMEDVLYVWEKLILDSDEISATGGRPTKKQPS